MANSDSSAPASRAGTPATRTSIVGAHANIV